MVSAQHEAGADTQTRGARPRPLVGVSHCLLGARLRYDGDHSLHPLMVATLGPQVRWAPLCPEERLGMGVPREAVRLIGPQARPAMIGQESGRDWSEEMRTWCAEAVEALASQGLAGFVLKGRSPSCGLGTTKRWPQAHAAAPTRDGTGLLAEALQTRLPGLPLIEAEDLEDEGACARFLARVWAYPGEVGP